MTPPANRKPHRLTLVNAGRRADLYFWTAQALALASEAARAESPAEARKLWTLAAENGTADESTKSYCLNRAKEAL